MTDDVTVSYNRTVLKPQVAVMPSSSGDAGTRGAGCEFLLEVMDLEPPAIACRGQSSTVWYGSRQYPAQTFPADPGT